MTARGAVRSALATQMLNPDHFGGWSGVSEQAAMAGVAADVEVLGVGTVVGLWLPVEQGRESAASEGCSAGRGLPCGHSVWAAVAGLRVQSLGQAGERPRGATAQPASGPAGALVRQHGRMGQGRPGEEARLFGAAQGEVVVEHPTLLCPRRLWSGRSLPAADRSGNRRAAGAVPLSPSP